VEFATIITAAIAAIVSIVTLLLNHKWKRDDDKAARKDECKKTLNRIERKLDEHIDADEQNSVRQARARIIVFADEITRGEKHSKEHFDSVRDDADYYDKYCVSHPDYPNRKAESAKALIDSTYTELQRTGEWL
jgi:hypothetical protein